MTRCFISVDVPEDIQREIIKIQKQLPEFQGKLTESGNLHLTLKFLGEIQDEKIRLVKERLKKIQYGRFETELKYAGFFDNAKEGKRYGPIWLHLSNCEGLQKKIDDSLEDIFPREKRFMSHLTIARVKNVENKKAFLKNLTEIKIPELKFSIGSFELRQSVLKPEGPVYSILEEYNLKI